MAQEISSSTVPLKFDGVPSFSNPFFFICNFVFVSLNIAKCGWFFFRQRMTSKIVKVMMKTSERMISMSGRFLCLISAFYFYFFVRMGGVTVVRIWLSFVIAFSIRTWSSHFKAEFDWICMVDSFWTFSFAFSLTVVSSFL